MIARSRVHLILAALAFAYASAGAQAPAKISNDAEVARSVVASGGGRSAGGSYIVHGTAGQSEAGTLPASNGRFTVTGGFWASSTQGPFDPSAIFADGFEN